MSQKSIDQDTSTSRPATVLQVFMQMIKSMFGRVLCFFGGHCWHVCGAETKEIVRFAAEAELPKEIQTPCDYSGSFERQWLLNRVCVKCGKRDNQIANYKQKIRQRNKRILHFVYPADFE